MYELYIVVVYVCVIYLCACYHAVRICCIMRMDGYVIASAFPFRMHVAMCVIIFYISLLCCRVVYT